MGREGKLNGKSSKREENDDFLLLKYGLCTGILSREYYVEFICACMCRHIHGNKFSFTFLQWRDLANSTLASDQG